MKNKINDPNKDCWCVYVLYKLYNTGDGKDSLEPYALYGNKG